MKEPVEKERTEAAPDEPISATALERAGWARIGGYIGVEYWYADDAGPVIVEEKGEEFVVRATLRLGRMPGYVIPGVKTMADLRTLVRFMRRS